MTSAGLPPIALEAVLKLLAIAEDNATMRKTVRVVAKPKLQLELTPPAVPFASQMRSATSAAAQRAARRGAPRKQANNSRPNAEGAESC
jgi:hypothetical protein